MRCVNSVLLDCRLLVTSRIILRAHQLGKGIVSTILAVSLTRFAKWLAKSKISLSALGINRLNDSGVMDL